MAHPDTAKPVPLKLELLGEPAWRDARGVRRPLSRKDAALLALLMLEGALTRGRLAALLWPEALARAAQANLRQRLHRLRRASGHAVADLAEVVRPAPGLSFDIDDEPAGAPVGEHADRLLGPYEYDDSEALADWVATMRERCQARRIEALTARAATLEARGELAAAIAANQRVLALAPLREHAWRRLMRLHHLRGDRAAAIEAFERCEQRLRAELGVPPHAETQALLALVEGAPAAPQAAVPGPLPPALSRPPRLVGRALEWRRMQAAWDAGRPFMLVAPAGYGKSRLWADFLAGRPGALLLRARAGDARTPYALIGRLIEQLLQRWPQELPAAGRRELARLLPELGAPPRAAAQQGVLWRAVEGLLQRAGDAGLAVLALDDLQFADLASIDLLRWLAASPALGGLRWALATRPDGDGAAATPVVLWLGDATRAELVPLVPWSEAEVCELLESLALPMLPASAQAALLFRHAGGHPFYTLETLKEHLLQGARPGRTLAQARPANVLALIEARLATLGAPALALLRLVAVVGSARDPGLLAQLAGSTVLSLTEPWAELERAGLLRAGEGEQDLVHDLVRETVLQRLPGAIARSLHEQVAVALAARDGADAAQVADHWQAARRWPEAARAYARAGAAARQTGRLQEQAALLEAAAAACAEAGDIGGQFDALHAALDSVLIRGGGEAMLAHAQRLLPLADTVERRTRLEMARADALLNLARHGEALAASTAALAAARDQAALLADALCLHGQALAQQGRFDEAIAALEEGRALPVSAAQRLHLLSALAFSCQAGQRVAMAIAAQTEALALAEQMEDAAETALAQGNLATLYAVCGDPRASARHAEAARRCHEDMGSARGVHAAINLVTLGQALAWMGRTEEALPALQAAVDGLGREAGAAAWAKSRVALAALQLALDQADAARATLAELLPGTPPVMAVQWHAARAGLPGCAAAASAMVRQLMAATPALRQHAAACCAWAPHADEPRDASQALALLREAAAARGEAGLARTLALHEAALRVAFDAPAAARLAAEAAPGIDSGLLATLLPDAARRLVAQVLAAAAVRPR